MTARMRALFPALAGMAALTAVALATPAASADVVPPSAVGPNTYFYAAVNPDRVSTGSVPTILVDCSNTIYPGEFGHPLAHQYVEAFRQLTPPANTAGYTGSAATQIDAFFNGAYGGGVITHQPVVITDFDVLVPIPTTLYVPCGVEGTVSFVPTPTSSTARSQSVRVDYFDVTG